QNLKKMYVIIMIKLRRWLIIGFLHHTSLLEEVPLLQITTTIPLQIFLQKTQRNETIHVLQADNLLTDSRTVVMLQIVDLLGIDADQVRRNSLEDVVRTLTDDPTMRMLGGMKAFQ